MSLRPLTVELAKWQLAVILAVFLMPLLLLLPNVAKYHGDECFYTDAAIRMMQTGDYLTPYAANGALRFAKPILPYWAVLAGYFVLGINFFAARIVFLLAGGLVIYLTYRLSLELFHRPTEAGLAALIVGSNVQLLTISIRSTPDALLCLFVLVSLLGFARLIFQNDTSWKSYAMAYLGAGLAVETRGLPGLGVAVFPFLFCLLFRRGQTKLRQLLEWRAVGLGVLLAFSWFGVMLWLHGRALIDGFYYDQVTDNVRDYRYLDTLRNLEAYSVGVLRHFLPWSALLAVGLMIDRRTAATYWRKHRSQCWFLIGWFLFILAPFVFGGYYRTRYMIVAYPLLSVFGAGLLSEYASLERFGRWMGKLIRWAALVFGAGGLAVVAAGAIIDSRLLAAGLLLLLAGGAVWQATRGGIRWTCWLAVAALPLTAFWAAELFVRPVFSKSPAIELTARLMPDGAMKQRVYGLNMSPSYQAQMRVFSGGRLTVVPLPVDSSNPLPAISDPLVFAQTERPLTTNQTGSLEQVGFASRKWPARDFLDLLHASRREAVYARNREPYYVLFPVPLTTPKH